MEGSGPRKDQAMIGSLAWSAPFLILRGEQEGAGNGASDLSDLCDETAIKSPNVMFMSFQIEHIYMAG